MTYSNTAYFANLNQLDPEKEAEEAGTLTTFAKVDDIKPGQVRVVTVKEKEVALFNVNGKFFAISNLCRHEGGPLCDGDLDGTVVTCPLHGWEYDITNGENHTEPEFTVKSYEVTVEGSDIKIKS